MLLLFAGCIPASSGKVLFRPPITHVVMVSAGLGGRDDSRWPEPAEKAERISAPPGVVGGQYSLLSKGHDTYVAVEEEVHQGAVPSVMLFDRNWHRLGELRPKSLRPHPGNYDWAVTARWSPDGRKLALSFQKAGEGSAILVGVVKPPSPDFHELFKGKGEWGDMVWAGDQLVWAYQAGDSDEQRVMMADWAGSTAMEVHRDRLDGYIEDLLPSPDGSLVVFDRCFYWPDKSGMWVLDVRAKECREATFEASDAYDHGPILWESSRSLLFSRATGRGTWDVYRAYLQGPAKARRNSRGTNEGPRRI